jgi:hypothetical protein
MDIDPTMQAAADAADCRLQSPTRRAPIFETRHPDPITQRRHQLSIFYMQCNVSGASGPGQSIIITDYYRLGG